MGARPPNDLDVILINTEQTSNRLQSSLQKDSPQRREPRRGRGWKWNQQDSGKRVWRYKFKLQKHPGRLYQTLGMFLQFCGKKRKKKIFSSEDISKGIMLTPNLGWKVLLQLKRNWEPMLIQKNAMNLKPFLYFSLLTCEVSF